MKRKIIEPGIQRVKNQLVQNFIFISHFNLRKLLLKAR